MIPTLASSATVAQATFEPEDFEPDDRESEDREPEEADEPEPDLPEDDEEPAPAGSPDFLADSPDLLPPPDLLSLPAEPLPPEPEPPEPEPPEPELPPAEPESPPEPLSDFAADPLSEGMTALPLALALARLSVR